jgi:hypothetical protein
MLVVRWTRQRLGERLAMTFSWGGEGGRKGRETVLSTRLSGGEYRMVALESVCAAMDFTYYGFF